MKTLLINGSPHKLGCTYTALSIVAEELQKNEINTEIFHIGNDAIKGCQGCAGCQKNDAHKCVFDNDCVNEAIIKAKESDGLIVGSPVHYASATGSVISFLDRFFMQAVHLLRTSHARA